MEAKAGPLRNRTINVMDQEFIDWAISMLGGNVAVTEEPHGDQSMVYILATPKENFFLKIAPGLAKERERLEWLNGKLPVPKVIGFTHIEDKNAILMTAIEGVDLAKLKKIWPANKIINKLAEVLRKFHVADIKDCPFGSPGPDKILVHGDACLP